MTEPATAGIWAPALPEAAPRGLCTDCGISRTSAPKHCGTACQFIKPDYAAAEARVHGRTRDPAHGDELFFGPIRRMLRASLAKPLPGAQWSGITTRIAERLLETGSVDAVLAMAPDPADRWKPMPVIVTKAADMAQCRGMRMGYAPLLALLEPARAQGHKRLAIIGIPCQVYALRALEEALGFDRLYVIGTPCSDNTTTARFHEFLALIAEDPDSVTYLEFRADYHVELRFVDGTTRAIPFLLLPLSKLPPDFFPLTCRTCVDYTNVLADITVGYMGGSGEQWVITRNARGEELLELLGDEIRLSALADAGKRHSAVAGFLKNVERAAGGLPLRGMPDWARPLVAWLMPRIGPRGLEFARARVEMKAVETVLHLRRAHPARLRSMVPAHVWRLVRPYGLTPAANETPRLPLATILALLLLATACAQAQAPDKSGYTLFNPTPEGQLRRFIPDRPNKDTSPNTIDAGHVQYEIDLLGFSRDSYTQDGTLQQLLFTANPMLRIGVTNAVEFGLMINGFQIQRAKNRETSTTQSAQGFGDIQLNLKIGLYGNDGDGLAVGVLPFVKIPTAAEGLGNNQIEGGVIIPVGFPLSEGIDILFDSEVDVLKNNADSGQHVVASQLVSADFEVTKKFGLSAELWAQYGSARTPAQYTADFGTTYLVTPNVQLDAGTYIGLNKAAPDIVGYFGLTQRF